MAEWLEVAPVERELDDLLVDVYVAAHDVPGPPAGQLAGQALGHGVVPHQLPAPAIRKKSRVKLTRLQK